ncbi:MAG: glycosyltransferase [Candidatus Competibacteraceae bacterium]|uniref:Glycosyltransferase 2-like domain-containing protein n=1 Tax=Candidatus Contendobacter odensis Run_B_J11 TaxID=1400861 RepID=A0A7U7GAW8_9GAMM|nr:glycosyltransferase [Candidatus Contendobacter odensis]MBK8536862.1 glycosyltransferase [Candidatus Competibacteraceae bacterium]MBK8752294.1 glycosyltransferase [Candidatus Competibacteraceae bacterium]CDH44393.1 hypothetical protein BN874_1630004 [Candidatus Contendobacter odensis Run_B_J11]
MTNRVDLHILTIARTRPEWLEQAIASVAGQPVNLCVIDNNGRATGAGRAQAYRESTAEFVACLDDDDVLLPGAIAACVAALDANPAALGAYTDALYMNESGQVLGPDVSTGSGPWCVERNLTGAGHTEHIAVMRRTAVLPFLDELETYTGMEQYFLHGMLATVGDWIHVEQPGYLFRLHPGNTHNQIPIEFRNATRQRIRQRLTAAGRVTPPRVDVHVLYCYEPTRWIDDALISLTAEPVNVHFLKGIQGKVGLARANAFRHGTAEYVAFVDADDEVVPGAFAAALEVLDARPEIVATYCDIQLIGEREGIGYLKAPWNPMSQLFGPSEVHHLHVMRRSAVEPCLEELEKWDGFEEYALMGLICQFGQQYHIPRPLYRFRQHNAYPRAGAIGGHPMRQAAARLVMPILCPLIQAGVRQ